MLESPVIHRGLRRMQFFQLNILWIKVWLESPVIHRGLRQSSRIFFISSSSVLLESPVIHRGLRHLNTNCSKEQIAGWRAPLFTGD